MNTKNTSGCPSGDSNRMPPEYLANKDKAHGRKSGNINMDASSPFSNTTLDFMGVFSESFRV
jgi:hypothetical protein